MIEENENKNEAILEEYLKPKWRQPRFWVWVILTVIIIIMAYIYKVTVIDTTIDPKVLKASIEFYNLNSQWIESEKLDTPEFKGIVLVPQLSFQVRNIGKVNLYYVYFLGVFRLQDSPKALGEGMVMAFKKPLKPGQESERIVLTSKFGYRASSKAAFYKNSKDWQNAVVQVFVRSGTANLVLLKTYYVSRKIEGLELDITITPTAQPPKDL